MVEEWMLTTTDNPFNPFTDYKQWYTWDATKGYHTPSLLARLTITSDEMSYEDQSLALRDAMNEIVKYNISGVHTIVKQDNENYKY